jgi:hypothetical protein
MADQIIAVMSGLPKRYQDMGDGTFAEVVVAAGGGGGGAANDRELITLVFRVTTAFSGASVGDLLTLTQILDVDGAAASVATVWRNQTTGADLGSAPSFANVELAGSGGSATAAKQDTIIGLIDTLEALVTGVQTRLDAANASLDAIEAQSISTAAVLTSSDSSAASVIPNLDTAAYTAGDVLFTAAEIANAVNSGKAALLAGVTVIDKDDQAAAGLDLYFFSIGTASMGARNAPATSITDADADKFLGRVSIASADWEDVGGAKIARVNAGNIPLVGEGSPNTSVWVIGVTRGTPTQTANGIVVRPFIVR